MINAGATLSKGLNRGVGTLLAGLLAVVIGELAGLSEGIINPIIIGSSAFVIGVPLLHLGFGFFCFALMCISERDTTFM